MTLVHDIIVVYVCSNCLKPFESNSPTERLCPDCLAVIEEQRANRKDVAIKAKNGLKAAALAVPVVIKKAPQAFKVAAKVAKNPEVQDKLKKAAAKVNDIAKIVK